MQNIAEYNVPAVYNMYLLVLRSTEYGTYEHTTWYCTTLHHTFNILIRTTAQVTMYESTSRVTLAPSHRSVSGQRAAGGWAGGRLS